MRPLSSKLESDPQQKHSKRRIWLTSYAPLAVWSIFVLGLGSGLGAANETSRIIRPILELLFPAASPEAISLYHGWIRKFAHFAVYAVLGWLACRAFRHSLHPFRTFPFAFALVFVISIAVIDETNQSFNPTRTGSLYDVFTDIAGGFTAIAFSYLIYRRGARIDSSRTFG